jgi:uncharacterized membrane protein YfcA
MMHLGYTLAGLVVGFFVGMTGVGGGSLMTPLLIFLFGVSPAVAVGTDLLFAAVTKMSGMWAHARKGTVHWPIVGRLALGSIPMAVTTVIVLDYLHVDRAKLNLVVSSGLGVALVLTSLALFFRRDMHRLSESVKRMLPSWESWRTPVTIMAGALLGILVPLTSVGAGALGAAMLMFLYPGLSTVRIVGSDIAHAVPLTAVAGLGHLHLGTVDGGLLGMLLLGSLPGIYLGSHLSTAVPEKVMRPLLASTLLVIGCKFILQ